MGTKEGFTLRIIFEGACVFVPDSPLFKGDKPGSPTSITVLLPDLRASGIAHWEEESWKEQSCGEQGKLWPVKEICYRPSHAPVLGLSPLDIPSCTRFSRDGIIKDPLSLEKRLLHVLDNEALSLGINTWPELGFESQVSHQAGSQKPVQGKDDRSLWWVPRMSEISPAHQMCKKVFLTMAPEMFPGEGIAARLELKGGHFSVAAFSDEGKPWYFAAVTRSSKDTASPVGESKWRRAIGNVIWCAVDIPGPEVRLQGVKGRVNEAWSVTLKPQRTGGIVELRIFNAEMEDIVFTPRHPWATPHLPDADFATLYRLTSGPQQGHRVVPIDRTRSGRLEKPCSSVVLSGSE